MTPRTIHPSIITKIIDAHNLGADVHQLAARFNTSGEQIRKALRANNLTPTPPIKHVERVHRDNMPIDGKPNPWTSYKGAKE